MSEKKVPGGELKNRGRSPTFPQLNSSSVQRSKMPVSSSKTSKLPPTNTKWSHEFDTLRRENLFRNPPRDHSAYPALKEAISPHVESFNALWGEDGLIAHGLKDIGSKTYLDGDERAGPAGKNRLEMQIKEVFVSKPILPDSNKFSTKNRLILPSECRERHVTYRGKMTVKFQYRVNNEDPKEFTREMGQLPLMLMVCYASRPLSALQADSSSQINVISKTTPPRNLCNERKRRKSWEDIS